MTPDDGEDNDAPFGPPPDPSLRHWRHPSEIASANAAALRDLSPVQPARWRSLSFLGGCAIGLIGVAILGSAVATSFTGGSDGLDSGALLATSLTSWASDSSETDSTLPPTTVSASPDPEAATTDNPAESPLTTVAPLLAPTTLPPTTLPPTVEAGASGVIAILDADDKSLIATGLVLDGMVISSAHALAGRSDVFLDTGDGHIEGLVAGTDPFSDLVVIATLEPDRLPVPISLTSADSDDGDNRATEPTAGSSVWVLAAGGQDTPTAMAGELTATGEEVMTSSGTMVFDALQTTVRTPVHGPGGAVVDQEGRTIGMVVACDRHLASALPIGTLRASAQSIRETGWAHIGWLGIEGEGSSDGIELRQVDAGGPAAAAGLAPGDLLLSVDGEPLKHVAGIVRAIRRAGVGNQVEFEVRRGSETFMTSITIGARVG